MPDPIDAFIEAASVPRDADHCSGTLDDAEQILHSHPHVATSNIYTASILGDEMTVREMLAREPQVATAPGGPRDWNALTYLCFSRYLRIDAARSQNFERTARALLDAGANANTGWIETIDHPNPRPILESAIYGAAAIARHCGLTRLLLERGADPNDEETPYHVPEGYDNSILKLLLESGKLTGESLTTMLIRKADWHDYHGLQLLLEHGADPNRMTRWGNNPLQHALKRDNGLPIIELMLDHGGDPTSGVVIAARKGRGDVLKLLQQRGFPLKLNGLDELLAACAMGDAETARAWIAQAPEGTHNLLREGGTILAEFAGNGNAKGVEVLLNLGIPVDAPYLHGDPYFDVAPKSTALHVAAWRAWPTVVKLLVDRGAAVNAIDGKGRTALQLAVKACVDSYWTNRRSPESVEALLKAGAVVSGVKIPSGYNEVDTLLQRSPYS